MNQDFEVVRQHCEKLKNTCIQPPCGWLKYPYITPTSSKVTNEGYHDLVDWDAIHAGIAFAMQGDVDPLKFSCMNLIDHIDENGKGYRRIACDKYVAASYNIRPWLNLGTFIAVRESKDLSFLKEKGRLQKLYSYLMYYKKNRMGKNGLYKWKCANESGMDNSLAYSTREENIVEAVDLNTMMVVEHTALAKIFEWAGDDRKAEELRLIAKHLKEKLLDVLFDAEEDMFYCNYNGKGEKGVFIRRKCYTLMFPLYAKLVEAETGKRIIEKHLLNPDEYWSEFGVRTMAKSDICFNNGIRGILLSYPKKEFGTEGVYFNCSNWQGPVWVISNFLMMIALKNYGYTEQARSLCDKTMKILANDIRQSGGMHENYDSETGKALCAAGFGSWNFLATVMYQELENEKSFYFEGLENF